MQLSIYTAVTAMCLALSSCVSDPATPPIHVSNVRLNPIWDDSIQSAKKRDHTKDPFDPWVQTERVPDAAEISAMNSRTIALAGAFQKAGFNVTSLLPGQPAPPVQYPMLHVSVSRYGEWCLKGLFTVWSGPDSHTSFELEQRGTTPIDPNYTTSSVHVPADTPERCSEMLVRELVQKVRP